MLPDIQPGNTKILYFFNCLLDGMHTKFPQFFNILKGDMSLVGVRDIIGTTRENSSIYAACVA